MMMTTTTTPTTNTTSSRRKVLLHRQSSSFAEASWHVTWGSLISGAVVLFSIYFPFAMAPWAASETYHMAFYEYDPDVSHFDNSLWTYGTDYALAVCMALLAKSITIGNPISRAHAFRSRGLLCCYLLSVMAGGMAHQFYTTIESRNTMSFRLLWTLCVGTVAAASGFMGSIGTELVLQDRDHGLSEMIPILPEWFWAGFGVVTTCLVAAGCLSYQRPACDIFIAGTTQFPSTCYMMAVFAVGLPTRPVKRWARVCGIMGFILNAPLLPMYPLLVQYTDLSLAAVNTILHTWLLVAWGMQGIALRHVGQCLLQASEPPRQAVPLKQSKVE